MLTIGANEMHKVLKIFNAQAVTKNGTAYSAVIDVSALQGYFSLQWVVTGDGTVKFEALSSNNGTDFLDINSDIASAQTKTTGPGADGKNMASFNIVPSIQIKLLITEANVNTATVSAWLKGY